MEIIILCGGAGEEREVSLSSGHCVEQALRLRGHTVCCYDLPSIQELSLLLGVCRRADAVVLAMHGGFGENGELQAALEAAGVRHYSGSGADASALAMQKSRAKAAVAALGVPVARGGLFTGELPPQWRPPYILKPEAGGSSVGFQLITQEEERLLFHPSEPYLCEEYLPGREYSVGVLAGRALPPVELCPIDGLYDYAHKYTAGATRELCPAPVDIYKRALLQNLALVCFSGLGLRDYARIDFKENAEGVPHFLEANTLPGMTQTSLLPLAAQVAGLEMGALCERMATLAKSRRG